VGANIEESRMTCLGSDFAVILRITAPSAVTLAELTTSLQRLLPSFLIAARPTSVASPAAFPSPVHILNISIEGPDQPGVVAAFTSSLSPASGCSVRDLDTDTSSAPFAGYRVFSLRCVVAVPMGGGGREEVMRGLKDFEETWGFDVIIDEEEAEGADAAEGEAGGNVPQAEVETDDVADSRHKARGRRQ
jgi:glycine cleavage system regulatory protein